MNEHHENHTFHTYFDDFVTFSCFFDFCHVWNSEASSLISAALFSKREAGFLVKLLESLVIPGYPAQIDLVLRF